MKKLGAALALVLAGGFLVDYVHLRREHAALHDAATRSVVVSERLVAVNRLTQKALDSCRNTLDAEVDLAHSRLWGRLTMSKAQQKAYKKKYGRDFNQDELNSFVLASLRGHDADYLSP